jgi:predicted Zn-dependent protease
MSLLADLLSKIKQPQTKRDVPPNLLNIVQGSAKKSADRRRIVLLASLFAVAILGGILLVYFTRTLSERSASDISITPRNQISVAEKKQQGMEGVAPGHPEISGSAETVQPSKAKEAVQSKETAATAVVSSKKQESVSRSAPSPEGRGKDILPNLEQVIVKQEAPDKIRDESGIDAFLYSASELEMKKDYQGALANYKKALDLDRNNYMVMNNIAYIYLSLGLISESVNYSKKVLELNKDYVPALINIGIASAKSGDISAAGEYLDQALKLDPDNKNVLLNLAVLHELQMNYSRAFEYFSRLMRSGNVSGTLGLARIYEKQEKTEEALKLYRAAYADSSLDGKTRAEVKQRIIVLSNKAQKTDN